MSVAFRREGDEEHKEPRFELPLPPGPNLVTAAGLRGIDAQVARLEAEVRDGQEGDARTAALRDLRYWRARAATAQVTAPPADGTVGFSTRVTFRMDGRDRSLALVGSDQADPAQGMIPFTAPLAVAMTGAEPGERVDFAGRREAIEILLVEPLTTDPIDQGSSSEASP